MITLKEIVMAALYAEGAVAIFLGVDLLVFLWRTRG